MIELLDVNQLMIEFGQLFVGGVALGLASHILGFVTSSLVSSFKLFTNY